MLLFFFCLKKAEFVNNPNMKKINLKNKSLNFMLNPLFLLSVLSVPVYILRLLGVENADTVYSAAVFVIVVFALFYNIGDVKKFKILFTVMLVLLIVYICFYDKLTDLLIKFSEKSAVRFGMLNTIFNTFGLYDFQNLADGTSHGGSFLINGKIVNGAVEAFKQNSFASGVSQFLTARFLLLFSLCGILLALGGKNIKICIAVLFAVLTGNYTVLLLFLAFLFPVHYLLSLIASFACSFVAAAMDLKFGFYCAPSAFELFIHNSNRIYSAVLCVFVFCISFYSASLAKEKLK